GVYTFRGGTDLLISKMKDELLKNNVDIKMQAKVEKIIIENGRASGVIVGGKSVRARSVLSNGNIRSTVLNLAGKEHFSPEYIQKTLDVRLNSSSCQVYMGLKSGAEIPYIGELVFTSTHP